MCGGGGKVDKMCPLCGFPQIPGITSCVNCGDVLEEDARPAGPVAPEQVAAWMEESRVAREISRQLTEARALEYAGDTATACQLYEALLARGCVYTAPYRRLAILYGKAKDRAAEERVVRAALAHLSAGVNGWFILRLAKILAAQRKQA